MSIQPAFRAAARSPGRGGAGDTVTAPLPTVALSTVALSTVALPTVALPAVPRPARRPAAVLGPRDFRPDIQGLRAVAVLLVVAYHAGVPAVTGGYVGVDVFFVISGFLITGGLLREVAASGRVSLTAFYARRIRRLLPPAALVLVVTLLAARIWGSVFQLVDTAWAAVFTALYAVNYRLAAEGVDYQQIGGPESPMQHFWSLAVEEQFYLLWPALVVLCVLGCRRRRWLLAVVLAGVCGASLLASVTVTGTDAPLAYFSLHTRAWELGAGALLAVAGPRLAALPARAAAVLSWAGLAAILWSGTVFTDETPFPGSAALVPVLGAAAVVAAGCATSQGTAEVLLRRRPMQGVGSVSYAWYLWHWPMVVLVPLMYGRTFEWWESAQVMVLALWLAVLTYWALESPTRHTRLRPGRWFDTGIALNGTVIGIATVLIVTVPTLVGTGVATTPLPLTQADVSAVQAAVGEATRTTSAPSNLVPRLSDVSLDQPATSGDGCHLGYLATQLKPCVHGDPTGSRTMVLTGDSHAQQWFPALDVAARQHHWRLVTWTKVACPIAAHEVYNANLRRVYGECATWREATVGAIVDLHPDVVVIGQSDTVPRGEVSNVGWAEGTVATIRRLQAAAIPVGFLLDTPYPGRSMPECVANHLRDVGACTSGRDEVWPYHGRHEEMARTLAAAGVTAVEPISWFCTLKDCPAIVNGMLVYRDESHVSTPYSAWLAPMMAPFFEDPP
ncbi:acyltransferase family protein [Pseudonocardia sp.]|jgi:peptidoglycan/LPS O-acetylase OafA/YrhL|uniref:acyltransferase family protein n=1 Tax=Pseudonocardia sp. TaxID=60912 RepID=UPI00261B3D3D|nr:acyltransferase family protein [Pseudonocardia sp.]